jgi:hypothetical protein
MAKVKTQPGAGECRLRVSAKLVSLNGGIVLAVCLLLTAVTFASVYTGRLVLSQALLFLFLTLASWVYLIDSVTEKLCLVGDTIQRTAFIGRNEEVQLTDVKSFLLKHEGLNASVGIESLTVVYQDGREERIPLGPCWRRRDLEAFLESVEQSMGYEGILAEEL